MRPIENIIAPVTDVDGICIAQQTGGAENLRLNGVLLNLPRGNAVLGNVAQIVQLTSGGNLSAVNFTVEGFDQNGAPAVETIAGPNANTVPTTITLTSVTRISSDAAVTSDIEAGITEPSAPFTTTPIVLNHRPSDKGFKLTQAVELSGTMTYTVQFTASDIFDTSSAPVWTDTDNTNLVAQSVSNVGNIFFPVRATRLNITVFTTGTAKFINLSDG